MAPEPHLAHMNDFGQIFFLLMTEIVYLGRSHKAFRNSSLGMTFAMSKLGVSKLFPEKKL